MFPYAFCLVSLTPFGERGEEKGIRQEYGAAAHPAAVARETALAFIGALVEDDEDRAAAEIGRLLLFCC